MVQILGTIDFFIDYREERTRQFLARYSEN